MADDDDHDSNGGGDNTPPSDEIGYRKPPRAYRYPKGYSGNPAGRPKGSKNKPVSIHHAKCDDILIEEAFRSVTVKQDGRFVEVPLWRVMIRNLAAQAAQGSVRAQKLMLMSTMGAMNRRKAAADQMLDAMIEYINDTKKVIADLQAKGQSTSHIFPHPDDIRWDIELGLPVWPDPAKEPSLDENKASLKFVEKIIKQNEKTFKSKKTEIEDKRKLHEVLPKLQSMRDHLNGKIKRQEE